MNRLKAVQELTIDDQLVNYIETEEGLLQLAQWGVLELHTWQTHVDHGMNPDQIVFDFDPDEELPFSKVTEGVIALKKLLDQIGLKSFVKTTGGKGLHVHVPVAPLYSWDQIKNFSRTICQQMESVEPNLYTTNMSKTKRKGKIFLDYLRNGFGSSSVAPFSLRSKEAPSVATPISWPEFKKLKDPKVFDMHSVLNRLAHQKIDPWSKYHTLKQKIKILKPTEN